MGKCCKYRKRVGGERLKINLIKIVKVYYLHAQKFSNNKKKKFQQSYSN